MKILLCDLPPNERVHQPRDDKIRYGETDRAKRNEGYEKRPLEHHDHAKNGEMSVVNTFSPNQCTNPN